MRTRTSHSCQLLTKRREGASVGGVPQLAGGHDDPQSNVCAGGVAIVAHLGDPLARPGLCLPAVMLAIAPSSEPRLPVDTP
jgi:hypothetical protein